MQVCIVIPVYNEEKILLQNVTRLRRFISAELQNETKPASALRLEYTILIADNASTDHTLEIARDLAASDANIQVLHLDEKGRGRALKTAWLRNRADILAYTDADLSTDLSAFPPLIEPLAAGAADLATGSRLLNPALTTRRLKRDILSRGYNVLVRRLLGIHIRDAQCGFKAITRKAADRLLPLVENTNWFFDTELLVLAERHGYRILELPVRWNENRDTHVKILRTVAEDLAGILRLRRKLAHFSESLPAKPPANEPLRSGQKDFLPTPGPPDA